MAGRFQYINGLLRFQLPDGTIRLQAMPVSGPSECSVPNGTMLIGASIHIDTSQFRFDQEFEYGRTYTSGMAVYLTHDGLNPAAGFESDVGWPIYEGSVSDGLVQIDHTVQGYSCYTWFDDAPRTVWLFAVVRRNLDSFDGSYEWQDELSISYPITVTPVEATTQPIVPEPPASDIVVQAIQVKALPNEIRIGRPVEFHVQCANIGTVAGTETINLWVNGALMASQEITIPASYRGYLTMTYVPDMIGEQAVCISSNSSSEAWYRY